MPKQNYSENYRYFIIQKFLNKKGFSSPYAHIKQLPLQNSESRSDYNITTSHQCLKNIHNFFLLSLRLFISKIIFLLYHVFLLHFLCYIFWKYVVDKLRFYNSVVCVCVCLCLNLFPWLYLIFSFFLFYK